MWNILFMAGGRAAISISDCAGGFMNMPLHFQPNGQNLLNEMFIELQEEAKTGEIEVGGQ